MYDTTIFDHIPTGHMIIHSLPLLVDSLESGKCNLYWEQEFSTSLRPFKPPTYIITIAQRCQICFFDFDLLHPLEMISLGEHLLEMSRLETAIRFSNAELNYDKSMRTSCFSTRVQAVPSFPARAVRPTRCTYFRMSTGASYDMT
jgi:hypothetical protein